MKEFEKWLKKAYPDANDFVRHCPTTSAYAWKAALDWVLENFDGKTDMLELALRIRKEMDYE